MSPDRLDLWLVVDFDGTVIDSYSPLKEVFRTILGPEMVKRALELEDDLDYREIYDKRILFEKLLGKADEDLIRKYWELRVKLSRPIKGALEVISRLKLRGIKLGILCGSDGQPGLKRWRIEQSPFHPFADDIKIVSEDIPDRRSYLSKLGKVAYVEDKTRPLREVLDLENVFGIRLIPEEAKFWPLKKSWSDSFSPTVHNWYEAEKLILKWFKMG